MARPKKISDPKDFPQDFWNYLVNPILGYYAEQPSLSTRGVLNERNKGEE